MLAKEFAQAAEVAQREEAERLKQQAQAVHLYRLDTDPEYRARIDGQMQALVRQQQEAERAADEAAATKAAKQAEIRAKAEAKAAAKAPDPESTTSGTTYLVAIVMVFVLIIGVNMAVKSA